MYGKSNEFYLLKMEYVSKFTVFVLQMMVKSGVENIFLKFARKGENWLTTFLLVSLQLHMMALSKFVQCVRT
jgi:hypothetical protein